MRSAGIVAIVATRSARVVIQVMGANAPGRPGSITSARKRWFIALRASSEPCSCGRISS